MLWFPFHLCNNKPEGTPVLDTGRFGLGLCALWVLSWKQLSTPTNIFFPTGMESQGQAG